MRKTLEEMERKIFEMDFKYDLKWLQGVGICIRLIAIPFAYANVVSKEGVLQEITWDAKANWEEIDDPRDWFDIEKFKITDR